MPPMAPNEKAGAENPPKAGADEPNAGADDPKAGADDAAPKLNDGAEELPALEAAPKAGAVEMPPPKLNDGALKAGADDLFSPFFTAAIASNNAH